MHGILKPTRRARRRRDERGAIAIIVAVSMVLILVAAAMVMDFGLVRIDRQVDRSAADSATLAGLHALNTGDGTSHPYLGVCTAIRYLKSNDARFAGIAETTGWTNGMGSATGNGCSDVALHNQKCVPTNKATWAKFHWAGTWQGVSLEVIVESGYVFTGSTWAEESLPASSADTGDREQLGCDQLAVTVKQSRKPGLGSLATSSDLVTAIRSVGRVKPVPGKSAPALLLLQRTGCPVLRAGNSGGGSGTFIHVLGAITSHGTSQPGTIHSDSDALGCSGGSNDNVFIGAQNAGIAAYAAPLVSNPTQADPKKPGSITSVAAANGAAANVIRDSLDNVHGSTALTSGGTKQEVTARTLIGRGLVDQRYFGGVKSALSAASGIFLAGSTSAPSGWTSLNGANACKATQAQVNALGLTSTSSLYVNCSGKFVGDGAGVSIPAGRVYFRGWLNPSGLVKLPNAHHVYIGNQSDVTDAISLGTGSSFEMNMAGNLTAGGTCADTQGPSKAALFVRSGDFKESGNGTMLRLCRTTAFMMGGRADGCVPTVEGTAPTSTPCTGINSGLGNGQLTQQGGDVDWTPPDTIDATLDSVTQAPLPEATAAWSDPNGPEDLALWSESASNTSTTYNMNGGGLFHVRGIYMVPNASRFKLSGGAGMSLTNAQYIVTSIELNGGTQITLSVNPDSAVTLPDLGLVGLVR